MSISCMQMLSAFATALLLSATAGLAAQAAAPAAAPVPELPALRVVASNAYERRPQAGDPGSTDLTVQILAEQLPPGTQMQRLVLTRAEDDLGRKIPYGDQSLLDSPVAGGTGSLTTHVRLGVIPRDATAIKLLEGGIELLVPSEADGSLVRIKELPKAGGPVERPLLTERNIVLWTYGDRASYERLCTEFGLDPAPPEPDFPQAAGFFVRDFSPVRRVLEYVLLDASGRAISTAKGAQQGSIETGLLVNIALPAPLPAGAQLLIPITRPRDVRIVPFRLEDLPLP